jgi:hypothetical protein
MAHQNSRSILGQIHGQKLSKLILCECEGGHSTSTENIKTLCDSRKSLHLGFRIDINKLLKVFGLQIILLGEMLTHLGVIENKLTELTVD